VYKVIHRTVAKSESESGYKISGRRKHGRDFLARERGRRNPLLGRGFLVSGPLFGSPLLSARETF
jgi:hypothetical protein